MTNDTDKLLDDVLSSWHRWASAPPTETGYPRENPTCRLYRTSRQYDDSNGALDSDQESSRMEAADAAINQLEQPYRTAVQFNARNLATGTAVWRSPRLPADDLQRAQMVVTARCMLLVLLGRVGIA